MTAVARATASASAGVADRHVEKSAVRLDVLQPNTLCGGDRRERADLVNDKIFDIARCHIELAPSEAFEIGKARVRTDATSWAAASATVARMTAGPPA